jgi:hypothetical protein
MFENDDENDEFLNMPVLPPVAQNDSPPPSPMMPQPGAQEANPADASPMNPLVKDYISKKFNLADFNPTARQAIVDDSKPGIGDHILAGLAAAGAGFMGQNAAAAGQNRLDASRKEGAQKVADFDASRKSALEFESQDPNSDSSKRFRATLKANFPEIAAKYGDAFDNLTAADQKSVFQVAETKAKIDGVAAQRSAALDMRKAVNDQRMDAAAEKKRKAITDQDDKDAKALQKHLGAGWMGRSGQAGVVQGNINAAERAEQLLEQAKTQPGGLDSRQIEELSQATAKLLGGGGANASARVEALVPHTFWGSTQSLSEYLSNHPTGAGLEKFTDRMADTVKREKDLAQKQKKQFQVEGLAAHSRLKKSNPDLYNELLQNNGIDPDTVGKKPAPETRVINGQQYQKVDGGWQLIEDMHLGAK